MTTTGRRLVLAGALLALNASGCAFANKASVHLSRNISVGQELLDLQRARESGAITDAEFETLKAKVLKFVDSIEIVDTVNKYTPDAVSDDGGEDD